MSIHIRTHHHPHSRRHATAGAAGLLGLTVLLLAPAPAHASRLPADPISVVATPVALTQLVNGTQATHVRAALADLLADH